MTIKLRHTTGCNLRGLVSQGHYWAFRKACDSHCTWIFKDTLGLFHLTSQRRWIRPAALLHFSLSLTSFTCLFLHSPLWLLFSLLYRFNFWKFCFALSSCLPLPSCLLCLWALGAEMGRTLVIFFFPCGSASGLPACWGDWDAADDAAAGSFLALITSRDRHMVWFAFLQPILIFHISNVNAPLKPSSLYFWSNLHHMPLMGDELTGERASL